MQDRLKKYVSNLGFITVTSWAFLRFIIFKGNVFPSKKKNKKSFFWDCDLSGIKLYINIATSGKKKK